MCFRVNFDKLPDWLVAIGTLSAVVVALWQSRGQQTESASRVLFEHAVNTLQTAVKDFSATTDAHGRPLNDRRHWLNFARGIGTSQAIAAKIRQAEYRELWTRTEHYWRERTYDLLKPAWDSFPPDYYGYVTEAEQHKNVGYSPDERAPLSEASLAFVYRWITWPEGYADAVDRSMKFTDEEIAKMETFGPRGLASYIGILRKLMKPK
jgi:hypothetical protein